MSLALGIEMVVGVVMLFGGGAWFLSEMQGLGERHLLGAPMGIVALVIAAIGGYIVWNGVTGGPLLLSPDLVRPWLPDRF